MTDLLIIGADGMDSKLASELMNEMPNIEELTEQNSTESGKMESYIVDGYSLPHTGPCILPDMEAYTIQGWKTHDEIQVGDFVLSLNPDTFEVEWKKVQKKQELQYDGKIYHIRSKNVDISLTADHNIITKEDDQLKRTPAKEIGSTFNIPLSGKQKNNQGRLSIPLSGQKEDKLKFLGCFIGDGNISKNSIRFTKTIEEDREKYKSILQSLDIEDTWEDDTNISFYHPKLASWLKRKVGKKSVEREIPNEIFNRCNTKELSILFDYLMFTDGDREKKRRYHTSSKDLVDDMIELGIRLGYATSFVNRGGGIQEIKGKEYEVYDRYRVNFDEKSDCEIRKHRHWREDEYQGLVWDLTVKDNHNFLVRRNGKTHFTGNCWTTLYTGVDEEGHGVSEGGWREGDSFFDQIHTIFDDISENGYNLSLCGMPMTYPAKDLNGWMISGFVTTTLKSLFKKKAIKPDDLSVPEDYIKYTAAYMAKKELGGIKPSTDTLKAQETLFEGERKRLNYFKDIWQDNKTDVVAYGTTLIDKVGHVSGSKTSNSLTRDAYSFVDDIVKELKDLTEPDHIMMCSDHGFQGKEHSLSGFSLNTGGERIKSIFDFAEAVLNNLDIQYEKDKMGMDGQPLSLSSKEKDDIKEQLEALGYLD